jgi:hypothetical protein
VPLRNAKMKKVDLNRPVYTRMPKKHLSIETMSSESRSGTGMERSRLDAAVIGAQGAFAEAERHRGRRSREDELGRARRELELYELAHTRDDYELERTRMEFNVQRSDEKRRGPFKGETRYEEFDRYSSPSPRKTGSPPSAHENKEAPKLLIPRSPERDAPTQIAETYVPAGETFRPGIGIPSITPVELRGAFADGKPLDIGTAYRGRNESEEGEGIGGMSVEEARRVMSEFLKGFSADEEGIDFDADVDRVGMGGVQEEKNQAGRNDQKGEKGDRDGE